tara:strand:- start:375 stop:821 length:447 start_codon:yes stop_codon:yes gene_type:complete
MSVSLIPSGAFNIVAKDVEKHLAKSIEMAHGRENMAVIWEALLKDERQLWMFFDEDNKAEGALVTRIEHYPLKKMLNLMFIGGENIEAWHEELLETLERYARENDCSGLETVGRKGWERFLKKFDWDAAYMVCEKNFDEVELEKQDVA